MDKIVFWSVIGGTFVILLGLLTNILAPFVISFILAYFLQPLIDYIVIKFNLSRKNVVSGIFIAFLSGFILIFILLIPVIYQQISTLINKVPEYNNYLQNELLPQLSSLTDDLEPSIADKVKTALQSFMKGAFNMLSKLLNNIWTYTLTTINVFAIILLVPLILFYLLRDWHKIIRTLESLLPLADKSKIREITCSINTLLSAYIRGQLNICLLLSLYYGVGLSIINIDLGLLIGIASGFLIIIPFIGTIIGFSLSLIIGFIDFGFTAKLIYIILLYLFGALIEGYYLTPKIIGNRIGLHPLWIMFAVLSCGTLLGFIGVFFAIPIAGITKVLLGYGIDWYKSSRVYKN